MKPRNPVIRPGQHTPYTKATRREVQQRLRAVAVLEAYGWETSDIYGFFEEVFRVGPRQIARYRERARESEAP